MNVKTERLASQFSRVISDIVRNDIKNKDLSLVTINEVILAKDMSVAKVYFTCLGGKEKQEADKKSLISATGFIKKELGLRIKMRRVPNLVFEYDNRGDIRSEFERKLSDAKDNNKF